MAFQQNEAAGGRDTTFSGEVGNGEAGIRDYGDDKARKARRNSGKSDGAGWSWREKWSARCQRSCRWTIRRCTRTTRWARWRWTRSAILAAATSTGGTLSKAPGRVGDSSLIGCGCYADNPSAAVSLTGWGEPIMKLVLGKWAVDRVAAGAVPEQAASDAIAHLFTRLGGRMAGLFCWGRMGGWGSRITRRGWRGGLRKRVGCRWGLRETGIRQ